MLPKPNAVGDAIRQTERTNATISCEGSHPTISIDFDVPIGWFPIGRSDRRHRRAARALKCGTIMQPNPLAWRRCAFLPPSRLPGDCCGPGPLLGSRCLHDKDRPSPRGGYHRVPGAIRCAQRAEQITRGLAGWRSRGARKYPVCRPRDKPVSHSDPLSPTLGRAGSVIQRRVTRG